MRLQVFQVINRKIYFKMKRTFVLFIAFSLCTVFFLSAQNKTDERKRQDLEKLREKRVAYFTEEIGLTEEEAKEFWPVCNELEEKKFEINRNVRQEIRKIRDAQRTGKSVSDAEYDRLVNIISNSKEKEVEIEKEYLKKIRKILSPEKVFKYQRVEYKFAREAFSPASSPPGKK